MPFNLPILNSFTIFLFSSPTTPQIPPSLTTMSTSVPEVHPEEVSRLNLGLSEDEPLLGRIGDASQRDGKPLYQNLILGLPLSLPPLSPTQLTPPGTAILAQLGLLLLVVLIYLSVFLHPLSLFSAHPLLNSTALLLVVEALLILQPTHTAAQKRSGTHVHATLHILALLLFLSAFIVIETNKFAHSAPHFTSLHGRLGLATYIILALQAAVGVTQYFTPGLYGGEDRAKKVYKWHRAVGYVVLLLLLGTVTAATRTETGREFLKLRTWAVVLAGTVVLVGVLPRVRLGKLGLEGGKRREEGEEGERERLVGEEGERS